MFVEQAQNEEEDEAVVYCKQYPAQNRLQGHKHKEVHATQNIER